MARNDVYGHLRVLEMETGALVFDVGDSRSEAIKEVTKPLGLTLYAQKIDPDLW